jgi:uncharacterized protein YbbK (DUF523 family)
VTAPNRPRIGVSGCLLGRPVRYDGGDKRDTFICEILDRHFELVAVCPEADAGLGIPRPPVILVGDPDRPRAMGRDDPTLDVTHRLESFARQALPDLGELSGFICKARSPSCALGTVPIHDQEGRRPLWVGNGIFMGMLRTRYPDLPVADESDIGDPERCESFLREVWQYEVRS